jgi:hypothetical protein
MADFPDQTVLQEHLHDVKADLHLGIPEQTQIIEARPRQSPFPLPINRRSGTSPFLGGASLYLDEHQALSIPKNQVDLPSVGSEIRGQEFHPGPAQMFPGRLLAESSTVKVLRLSLPVSELLEEIPDSHAHGLRQCLVAAQAKLPHAPAA